MTGPWLYLDTSALAKLVVTERFSPELREFVGVSPLASSILAEVELRRAAARRGTRGTLERAQAVLDRMTLFSLTEPVLELAAEVGPLQLRSLDAIHLASALRIRRDLEAFVTYDRQLGQAARDQGLSVASPGL